MKKWLCWMLLLFLPVFSCAEERLTALSVYGLWQSGDEHAVWLLFDETMRDALTEKDLDDTLKNVENALGPVVRFGDEETSVSGPYRITALPVRYQMGSLLFQVTWEGEKIAGLYFSVLPPEALKEEELPEGIVEESVSIGDPPLPGALTLPANASAPLPAVVLLHGSGPNDMNETMGQTRLFRDLAWELARQGIAVLRYDKRTYVYGAVYSKQQLHSMTVKEEAMDDAVQAVQLLRDDPRIDADRILLAGHSFGACIAPRIAADFPGLFSGLILLSGTPVTLAEIMIHQQAALLESLPDADLSSVEAMVNQWNQLLTCTAEEALQRDLFGQPAYYFWDLGRYDIGNTLAALETPALIINGGEDFQVPDADGIEAWQALDLPDRVTILYAPGLNHCLMHPDVPDDLRRTAQAYEVPCHVDAEIIQEIAQYILE